MAFAQPQRLAQMRARAADQPDHVAGGLEGQIHLLVVIGEQANPANRRRRQNGVAAAGRLALVVEADVARHDRIVQRPAGFGHALDAADQLAHDHRVLRAGKVQAVGDGQRLAAHRHDVAPGLRHGLFAALKRIGKAVTRRAIGGDGQRLLRAMHPHHGGIAARALQRVGANLAIILFPDPAA